MTELQKIKLSDIFANCQFWYATLVLYFQTRGIPTEQIFLLLSIYSMSAFLLEYPTGVISDHFSPKLSLILGYIISAICVFLVTFPGGIVYYSILHICLALGFTLTSGSDTALLHAASKNFKQDYAQVKFWGLIMTATAAAVGGLVAVYDIRFSYYLTSLFFIISTLLLLRVGAYHYTPEGNIFSTARKGIDHVLENRRLQHLFIVSGFIGIFIISFKFFYNPLFQNTHLSLPLWGIFISISTVLSAAGIFLFKRFKEISLSIIFSFLILSIFLMGIVWLPAIALGAFFVTYLIRGYIETQLDVLMNEAITSEARASVLSFRQVFVRIGQTGYTFLGGLIIAKGSIFPLLACTSIILVIVSIYPLYRIQTYAKK